MSSGSVNAELVGGIVAGVLSIVVAAVVIILILLCLYRRYYRTANMPMKKIEQ